LGFFFWFEESHSCKKVSVIIKLNEGDSDENIKEDRFPVN
jgi:hypothetical protein